MRAVERERGGMTDIERLSMMFRAFREHDDTAFLRAAESLIADELAANHLAVARELQTALEPSGRKRPLTNGHSLKLIPKDRRSDNPLVTMQTPKVDPAQLVLVCDTRKQIDRVLAEQQQKQKLARSGYKPKSKLLFWGPPGCGKTLTAQFLAQALHLQFGILRLSSVISSLLGDTASNIQSVFDTATNTPMVLLLDEVDAIAKNRDDPNDIGEVNRVVNGLLQALDCFTLNASILIAASNHQYLLDPALWRRFDDVIYFPLPSSAARSEFIQRLLNGVTCDVSHDALAKKMNGLSFADIERVIVDAIKTMILEDRRTLQLDDIVGQLKQFTRTRSAALRSPQGRNNGI